ncbi:hypothetical protein SASPL_157676 [Salvia splendens]|uniref:Inositol-1-monophosphatase n=1 Tax=Salvia splendens TaxID=180675 RepID=A0A8X8YTW4_SALSN|nr:hypothetical protein SASPL_157676 [Salvia splendens]
MAEKGATPIISPRALNYVHNAVEAAKKAGEVSFCNLISYEFDSQSTGLQIIRRGFYETKLVEHKGLVDLVTETDKACEELIFSSLKQQYPDHKFIGEETTAACGVTELTDEPTWIVDPLDGTTNFVHGQLFTAIHGKGAFLNGKSIKASSQTELVKSLLATEAGTKRDKATLDASTNRINSLLFKVRSLRMSGSCALNLCGIACGRLDLFYEVGFGGPWDVAAGAVILTEAGGHVFDPTGKEFDITAQRVAASNGFLKDAFVDALKQSE